MKIFLGAEIQVYQSRYQDNKSGRSAHRPPTGVLLMRRALLESRSYRPITYLHISYRGLLSTFIFQLALTTQSALAN